MECPKCGLEIDDKTIVCPNCKKVLKVVCPVCKTINKGNTCKKCGYVIIGKCNKCGKINLTGDKKCKKCGFSTEQSVILNESNTDNFTALTIEFPNMSEMKVLLGSAKLLNKFKANLDKIIADIAKEAGVRRQLIGNTYMIRFYKDYTFNSTANTAMNTAIQILTEITKMNYRLTNKKNASVRCNMFLMKRTVQDDPYDINSGFNISMVNQSTDERSKLMNSFQVIVDNNINDAVGSEFKFSPLNSVMVKGQMVTFYEADVSNLIIINYDELDEKDEEIEVPNFVQNLLVEQDKLDGEALSKMEKPFDPDSIYDIETINFSEITCDFIRTENIDVFFHVINRLQTVPKGIMAVRTAPLYVPYSLKLVTTIADLNLYKNIITVTCYDEMKYSPYSFFRELVSAIFEYTVSQKLFSQNDFSMFKSIDTDGLIKDLITFTERDIDSSRDTRYTYFDIFMTLLQAIPNTLIFIENFDKIDTSSYDVLKYLFESFEKLDISYLIQYDKDFSLHKDLHFLLAKNYYTEITLKPTSFEKMIEENKEYYRNIMDSFYFQRIAKYSFGSILFLDIAIQYLIESGVFEATDDAINLVNPKTIIIPSSLNKLVKRRLNLLQDYPDAIKFLAEVVLLGPRIDQETIKSLGVPNLNEVIDQLSTMGYIYFYNNCMYFPNYNILRENLLETLSQDMLKDVAKELFEKVFVESMPSPEKAYLYSLMGDHQSEFKEWEQLAKIDISLGDFNSYLNCADRILKILDMNTDEEAQEDIDKYKLELYENISNNLFDYVPENTFAIAEETLAHLEHTTDADKIIALCNKMIQGCLLSGNYMHALELTHKVLSMMPNASIDPAATDFNHYFFLMTLVHVEILFNIGAWEDCLDIGYRVLNVVNQENLANLKPDYMAVEQFEAIIINTIGYVAAVNVLQLKGNVQEFLNIVRTDLTKVPHSYDIFIAFQDLLAGRTPNYDNSLASDDKFSAPIFHILEAFTRCTHDYNVFAEEIYEAKILAKCNGLYQFELFADLMIAYCYIKLNSLQKASLIIYRIIKTANENGMTNLLYVAWYIMSELNLAQGKYIVTYGIVNNSLIQLEKSDGANEYLLLLFKYNMYKVLRFRGKDESAQICLAQAQYLANKHGITFNFDTDDSHYIPMEDPDEESLVPNNGEREQVSIDVTNGQKSSEHSEQNNSENNAEQESEG